MTDIPEWVDPRMHKYYHSTWGGAERCFRACDHYGGAKLDYIGYSDDLRPTGLLPQGICRYCARAPQVLHPDNRSIFKCCVCTSAVNEMELTKAIESVQRVANQQIYELKQRAKTECPQNFERLKAYALAAIEHQFKNPKDVDRLEIR